MRKVKSDESPRTVVCVFPGKSPIEHTKALNVKEKVNILGGM